MKASISRIAALWVVAACARCPAGVIIDLVPTPPPYFGGDETTWVYGDYDTVYIDVVARLDGSGPDSIAVRSLQLDLGNTNASLLLFSIAPGAPQGSLFSWDFSSTPSCQDDPHNCGQGYLVDDSILTDTVFRIDFLGASENPMEQVTLTDSNTRIGSIGVQGFPGAFVLDFVSTWSHPLSGASIAYGFDTQTDPLGEFSAQEGTISGGRVTLLFVPEPLTLPLLVAGMILITRRGSAWTG